MSLTKCEVIEKNRYELQFAVDKETFEKAVNAVYRKMVKNITVPGFRKGKAPKSVVERMYGKGVFYEDAINEVLPEAFGAAVEESKLDIVGNPEFDIVSIDDNGLVMSAKVFVKPDITVANYVGIEVKKDVAKVTDEEIENEINMVRERNSRETRSIWFARETPARSRSLTEQLRAATTLSSTTPVLLTAFFSTAAQLKSSPFFLAPVSSFPASRSRLWARTSVTSST